jgi:hypothetical protein
MQKVVKRDIVKDYVYYLKIHEELRTPTNERNKFWKEYRKSGE